MSLLASVAEKQHYKDIFSNEETLKSIISQVVVPNVSLREVDHEVFEDDPDEFIRRDIEGSGTRSSKS